MYVRIVLIFALGLGLWLGMFLLTYNKEPANELLIHLGKSGATLAVLTVLGALVHHELKERDDRRKAAVKRRDETREAAIKERERARREEEARHEFYRAVLADFKSVYDRVERCRLLVEAHRSAKTYGEQLRELVGGVVTLHNIKRALDPSFPNLKKELDDPINKMTRFLKELLEEFRDEYREISHRQAADEAWNRQQRQILATSERRPEDYQPLSRAWQRIKKLDKLGALREDDRYEEYYEGFVRYLDEASGILRRRLPVTEEAASATSPTASPAQPS